MDTEYDNVIGIVGGMGPQAGNALFNRITCNTPATSDQEHLPVILASFPSEITDRTLYLDGLVRENPAHAINLVIERLEQAGAAIIGIACNTSHAPAIFDVIREGLLARSSTVQLLHMPNETCQYIRQHMPMVSRVGLMTTNGTYRSRLYKNILESMGYEVVVPDPEFQNDVIHRMVYDPEWGIKANPAEIRQEVKMLLERALDFFSGANTEAIILGCTEFSLLFKKTMARGMPLVDATDCLAKALVRIATAHTGELLVFDEVFIQQEDRHNKIQKR
jgi:aspartate racemase